MKRFNLLYYLFILASMLLSVIMAPAMFIQQNAMASWLWILVFLTMLFFLQLDALLRVDFIGKETQKLFDAYLKFMEYKVQDTSWNLYNYSTYDRYDDTDTIREAQ